MRGKVGIVVGLAAGYVLGSRAGRERYEQIKTNFLKVWNTDPVQRQVSKVTELGKSAAMALPSVLWDGALKVTQAATKKGTPGERLDAAVRAGKQSADDVTRAAEVTAAEAKRTATEAKRTASKAASKAEKPSGS